VFIAPARTDTAEEHMDDVPSSRMLLDKDIHPRDARLPEAGAGS